MLLKGYDRKKYSQRYGEYKRCFVVQALVFIVFLAVGAFIWNKVSLSSLGEKLVAEELGSGGVGQGFFQVISAFEMYAIALTLFFASGITVYAPFVSFALMAYLGITQGIVLGAHFRLLSDGGSILRMLWDCFFGFFSAGICFGYGSFCLCVSFKHTGVIPDTDQRIFSGSLFCSSFYKNIVNLRFLLFYIIIFFAVSIIQLLVSWGYCAVMGCL